MILKNTHYNFCDNAFKLMMILISFMTVFTIFEKSTIVSTCNSISYLILLTVFLVSVLMNNRIDKNIIILFVLIIFSLISIINTCETITFDYLKKYFMFIATCIMFYLIYEMDSKKDIITFILILNIIFSIIYNFAYYFLHINTEIANSITLNFPNPNQTGMFLLHSILYNLLGLKHFKNFYFKIFITINTLMLVYILFLTKARSCIIGLIFYLVFYILKFAKYKSKNNLFKSKITIFLIVIFPLIFALIYIFVVNSGNIESFSFMESEGKSMTSRYLIWSYTLKVIKRFPITGNYFIISGGTGHSQLHNTHLDIIASYGIPVLILFVIYLTNIVTNIASKINNNFEFLSLIAFFAIIIMGSFEASLVSGSMGMYIMTAGFLYMAKNDNKEICI